MTSSKQLQAQIEAARADLTAVLHQQEDERAEAARLIGEGERRMKLLDAVRDPGIQKLEALERARQNRLMRTLDAWEVTNERWGQYNRYIVGRTHTYGTNIAWLRVGLWLPLPYWFLDIRYWSSCKGVTNGQFNLGAPNERDPEDSLKRRAESDELLIKAGFLLIEREDA